MTVDKKIENIQNITVKKKRALCALLEQAGKEGDVMKSSKKLKVITALAGICFLIIFASTNMQEGTNAPSLIPDAIATERARQSITALVAHADSNDAGLTSYLSSDPRFSTVAALDARYSTPTLGDLLNYDVVVTWTNNVYHDQNTFGNNLKSYVDAGGGVVVGIFAHDTGGFGLAGSWLSANYDPIQQMTGVDFYTTTIGTIDDPSHPIMDGVSDVSTSFVLKSATLTAGASPIFHWKYGSYIGCAVKTIGPGRTVGLNQFFNMDGGSHSDLIIANSAAWAGRYDDGALINDLIRARSGSESCSECDGGSGLPAGFPDYDISPDLYRDFFTIENISGSPLTIPIRAELTSLTAGAAAIAPPAFGTGEPGGTHWKFSDADYCSTGVSGTTFPAGAKISERWALDPDANPFELWVDLYSPGKGVERLGWFDSSAGPTDRAPAPKGDGDVFVVDDGTAEIHTGSSDGMCVLANRFALSSSVSLKAVLFYTSGAAAGDRGEVIIYEDPTGAAPGPDSAIEVWRTTIALGTGGFQEVIMVDCPTINASGAPDAAFYVTVANRAERSYSIGVDLTDPYTGASYVSTDGGLTFAPLSTIPIIDGNAMIRAGVEEAGVCFLGAVM